MDFFDRLRLHDPGDAFHNSGVLPNRRAIFRHMTGDSGFGSARMPVPCHVQILRLRCRFERLKDEHALPDILSTDPPRLTCEVYLLKAFIPEAGNHPVYSVNWSISGER
jgi:hypothetical protein